MTEKGRKAVSVSHNCIEHRSHIYKANPERNIEREMPNGSKLN